MRRPLRPAGHTLVEMIVAMVVMGVVGAGIVRLIVSQSRGFQAQDASAEARKVARAAVNLIASELRMVEVSAGVSAASATSVTVRVPYAMGIVCANSTMSTMPVDSLMYANATFAGYAWRDTLQGSYTYVTASATVSAGTAATCTAASVTTLTGGKVLAFGPVLSGSSAWNVGTPIFLFQSVTYAFGASGLISGRWGLFRTVGAGTPEEIAAPFDSATSRFKFFVLNADTSQAAVPASLANIRGIELVFTGASRQTPRGRTTPKTESITTAVFFQNRLN